MSAEPLKSPQPALVVLYPLRSLLVDVGAVRIFSLGIRIYGVVCNPPIGRPMECNI